MKTKRLSDIIVVSTFFFIAFFHLFIGTSFAQAPGEISLASSASTPVTTSVSSNEFNLSFSREGASLKNFNLKTIKYKDNFSYDRQDLETLDASLVKKAPFTLSLFSAATDGVLFSDTDLLYELKEEKPNASSTKLIFTGNLPVGSASVTIVKTYNIDHIKKTTTVSIKIKNTSQSSVSFGNANYGAMALNFWSNLGQNAVDDEQIANFGGSLYKTTVTSNKHKYDFKPATPNDVRYMAVRDSYYVAILGFEAGEKPVSAVCAANGLQLKNKMGFISDFKINFPAFSLEAGEVKSYEFFLYMGVKSYDEIKKLDKGFEDICEFNFLALLILQSLTFFYGITKNYGLSIILLTIAIKLILQPLTNKQTKSMKEMQKIQPYINEIKKKYANDTQKTNEEVMKLYKEHGVNPFGGCLPLLLQLPILFALFTALRSSVELKGEAFLWMPDLSMADPTWILPIAIAISMHLQQSQMQVDPQQAAAFQFMPIFMFFITYTLPAGVLLYWGVSNILQVIQQWYDKRKDGNVQVIAAEPEKNGNVESKKNKKEVSPE